MTNSAKVIYNMKEVKSNTGEPPGPLGRTSEDATLPELSLAAKAEVEMESCRGVRREIVRSRPEIDLTTISYMRLTLLKPKMAEYDGRQFNRLAVNMDVSFNNRPEFQKFKWRVTGKRSEYYANLPEGWENDFALGSAWEYYNELSTTRWIGKACYRMTRKESAAQMKLVPLTAIVMHAVGEDIHYKLWIENAEVSGVFNIDVNSKYYTYASEPIKNFRPSGARIIQL